MRVLAQSIVETVRHPLLILDGDLRVQQANQPYYRMFEVDEGQTVGQLFLELGEGQWNIPELRQLLDEVVPDDRFFEDFVVQHDFVGLGPRVLILNARRVSQDDGKPMILLAIEDGTEKRQVEAELANLNERLESRVLERTAQLEASNKELEAFCYSVSHDLRSPLRGISGFSQELLCSYSDKLDDQGRHYLARIQTGSQRMGELIDDMLTLSRITRSEMSRETVDLSESGRAISEELRSREPSRKVNCMIQPGLTVQGDPRLLRIALENLFENAWKFTSKKTEANVDFGSSDQNGRTEYFVRDDGAGFDPKFGGKLFGAFQRLHSAREFPGTGIGLATVQRVVRRHGGDVWAEGAVEHGATFFFTLN